jgi:carboxyl-terminal processing protease
LNSTYRALSAAAVIALASLAGALYLAHEAVGRQVDPQAMLDSGAGIATLDLRNLLNNPQMADQRLLDGAFRQVERAYYKPVNAQLLVNGEQRELVLYLKTHHAADPTIPLASATGDETHDLEILNRNLRLAQQHTGGTAANAQLTQAAIRGMMNALGDPYTTYLSPAEITSLDESLRGGDFGGVGVYIVEDPRTKQVLVEPIEGTPAYRAGIKTGDQVLAIDGKPVSTIKLDQVERMIRGRVGTTVNLLLKSPHVNVAHTVVLTREQIYVPSVHAKMEDGFEYVRLADFGQTSYEEVRRAMLNGKAHGARGYILDLRNNGGGLLDAAVQISSLFIPQGTIVSTIERNGNRESREATHDVIGAAPLVVLVNKYTASASEITAGAVQDYHVGTLIGTKTFGKGVVQSIYNTSDGGALKITTARYVTPLGRDIHHKGIDPDVTIDQPIEGPIIDTPRDVQLAAAKAHLRRLASR